MRKTSASETRIKKENFLTEEGAKNDYMQDLSMYEGSVTFMNGYQNYSLLNQQKTNLYKCILVNLLALKANKGFAGIIQPSGIFDDPKASVLRAYIYPQLKYLFGFINELVLFAEVDHHLVYSINVFGERKAEPYFLMIGNVFHPATIDESFSHDGHGLVTGIKVYDNSRNKWIWNLKGHKSRIVRISSKALQTMAFAFENRTNWQGAKLVTLHSQEMIDIISKFGAFNTRVADFEQTITVCWDETGAQKAGFIRRNTQYPSLNRLELIYSGPHFFVGNPIYKTPRAKCNLNSDYDPLDLTKIDANYLPLTNYVPATELLGFKDKQKGFEIGKDDQGKPIYDDWFGYYKFAFRRRLSLSGERTLIGVTILPNTSHVNTVISVCFRDQQKLLEFSALTFSIVLDFFVKTIGKADIYSDNILDFPLGLDSKFHAHLFPRTLALNCLNQYYALLWERNWQAEFSNTQWAVRSVTPLPLSDWSTRTPTWAWESPLRNYYERRQALVELDVLVAMALGLTLEQLLAMYRIQFPVLQQNEQDTWYDQTGNIVFTCSKGLSGVGLDSKTWATVRNLAAGEYVHTITKKQSELYANKQVTYYAPFFKADREQDYVVAWEVFEGVVL
jgi:hypothetical protein